MNRSLKSKSIAIALSSLLFWIPVVLFATIANEVIERKPLPGDIAILEFIHRHISPHLGRFFLLFTDLGSTVGIIALTGTLLAYLLYRHRRHASLVLIAGVAGAAVANVLIKLLFKRQRPTLWHAIVSEPGFSFPSGHAMASSALVFTLILLSWRTRWRWPVICIGVPFFLLVSLSRLYFGVHYPSDILGGWLASFLWVSIIAFVVNNRNRAAIQRRFSAWYHGDEDK